MSSTKLLKSSELLLVRKVKSCAPDINASLNFRALLPILQRPRLRFLTRKQLKLLVKQLEKRYSDSSIANELLLILDEDNPSSIRKFIACLLEEQQHRGHRDVADRLMKTIPRVEAEKIQRLRADQTPVARCAVHPMEIQGSLRGKHFTKLDRELWSRFNVGEYDRLSELTVRIRRLPRYTNDQKIVAMWFDSLTAMHRDEMSISKHLLPALELCRESENRLILEGRIYQRMGQLYLILGLQEEADYCIGLAEYSLQFVARGYEKVNMLCRKAKLLSATEPDKRDLIEDLYIRALAAISEDDPFIMASRPSIILSTAAFYLHMSFGSKPNGPLPHISEADIAKAKAILDRLPNNEVILEMRKCEFKVLSAELQRIKGAQQNALELFNEVLRDAHAAKLCNLAAIAEHRKAACVMKSSATTEGMTIDIVE